MTCRPSGENIRQETLFVCPLHFNGCAGHDNNFLLRTLIALANHVLKIVDNGDSEGRNGCVDI